MGPSQPRRFERHQPASTLKRSRSSERDSDRKRRRLDDSVHERDHGASSVGRDCGERFDSPQRRIGAPGKGGCDNRGHRPSLVRDAKQRSNAVPAERQVIEQHVAVPSALVSFVGALPDRAFFNGMCASLL